MYRTLSAALMCLAALTSWASAATFYCDPVNGSLAGDGSQANPWPGLQALFDNNMIQSYGGNHVLKNAGAPVKGGDTLLLLDGYHGEIDAEQYFNDQTITVQAAPGHTPKLRRIYFWGGSRWTFRGLHISPSEAPVFSKATCVTFMSRFGAGNSMYNVIEDCFMYSALDTTGWTAADWVNKSCSGIHFEQEGRFNTARNNHMYNVDFGIYGQSEDSLIEYNVIENFAGDGIRATGCGTVYQYNTIKNCYNVDDNHDDGIQGFYAINPGTVVIDDVVLRGNLIINRTDPNQPHQGPLQGIGCFDGPYEDWIVENNVVLTNHWHGITLYDARGCQIVNNTVFNKWYYDGVTSYQTWIDIVPGQYYPNIVRNNIAHRIYNYPTLFVADHNTIISRSDPVDQWFVDYENFDMHPTALFPGVDAGSSDLAPDFDRDGCVRPFGFGYDIGAYEQGSYPPVVADAGDDVSLIDADDNGLEVVMLDGSGTFSITGTIVQYTWYEGAQLVGMGMIAPVVASVGEHTYRLEAINDLGQSGTDEVFVTVAASGPTPGDINGDGAIDIQDFVILKQNYGMTSGASWAHGDFNADGAVDIQDFVLLKQNYGS